jgi:hypothetical protein
VLASEKKARELGLMKRAVRVKASVMTSDPWQERDLVMPDVNTCTRLAAKKATRWAGVSARDINLVELHDCFATAEILHYENLGLCGEGEAGKLIDNGEVAARRPRPGERVGRPASKGHPLGATGTRTSTRSRRTCAARRASARCRTRGSALTHVIGLGSACGIHILEKASAQARADAHAGVRSACCPRDWVKNTARACAAAVRREAVRARSGGPRRAGCGCIPAASAGYVWNDCRPRGRPAPPREARSPARVGHDAPRPALLLSAALAAGALLLAWPLPASVARCIAASLALMAVYSFWLKRVPIVDVFAIGAFYVLRVLVGSFAVGVTASDWLLMATGLIAVFLGLCKRRHELLLLGDAAAGHRAAPGRYSGRFLDAAISLTTSTTPIAHIPLRRLGGNGGEVRLARMPAGAPFVFYGLSVTCTSSTPRARRQSDGARGHGSGRAGVAIGFAIACGP